MDSILIKKPPIFNENAISLLELCSKFVVACFRMLYGDKFSVELGKGFSSFAYFKINNKLTPLMYLKIYSFTVS